MCHVKAFVKCVQAYYSWAQPDMQVVRPEDVEVTLLELSFISNEASTTCCATLRDAHCATQQTARQFLACLAFPICAAKNKHKSEKCASQASWYKCCTFCWCLFAGAQATIWCQGSHGNCQEPGSLCRR